MREDILQELENCKATLQQAIDHIKYHSISKLDILLYLQEVNSDESAEFVKGFYEKFFRDEKEDDLEKGEYDTDI